MHLPTKYTTKVAKNVKRSGLILTWHFRLAILVLGGLFLALTFFQLLAFPGQFRSEANAGQGSRMAQWVLTLIVGIWFLLAQIAVVAIIKILMLIMNCEISSDRGRYWLTLLLRVLAGATVYGGSITVFAGVKAEEPGPAVITTALTIFSASLYFVTYFVRYHILNSATRIELLEEK